MTTTIEIFVFASKNLTNIWAGIGARLWAVSQTEDASTAQGRRTKAQNMRIGSFGIPYCNDTHSLTTPFIVYSKVNPDRVIEDIWPRPEKWVLPFQIFPLGNPHLQLSTDEAKRILPVFRTSGEANFGKIFHVQAVTAFSPTRVGLDDWEVLISRLAQRSMDANPGA